MGLSVHANSFACSALVEELINLLGSIDIGILQLVSLNIVIRSVFNALSIGSGLVAAVFLCMKRDDIILPLFSLLLLSHQLN